MARRGGLAAGLPTRGGPVSAAARRAPGAADIRGAYHRRLEDLVSRATDTFREVVRNSEVTGPATNARAEFQIRVDASALAQAAEGLLRLIAELKVAAIVQDSKSTGEEASEVRKELGELTKRSSVELSNLRASVDQALVDLETHYFQSVVSFPAREINR